VDLIIRGKNSATANPLETHVARSLKNTPKPQDHNPKAESGDNSAALEEANRVQLISIVSRLSAAEGPIEQATVVLKAARKERSKIIGLAKAAGFPAWEVEARLAEMKRPAREMAEIEKRERQQRRWLGILDDEQSELILGEKVPDDARDEAHWKGEGYKAGLRQMSSTAPPECPAMHTQAFMKEHERGLKEVLTANVPGGKRLSVAEKAAADFKADNPDAPEPGTPEAQAAERKAVAKAKAALEKLGGTDEQVAAAQEESRRLAAETINDPPTHDPLASDVSEEPFEMTEEERAAQAGRPAQEVEPDEAVV
jgi:hypothetical protein